MILLDPGFSPLWLWLIALGLSVVGLIYSQPCGWNAYWDEELDQMVWYWYWDEIQCGGPDPGSESEAQPLPTAYTKRCNLTLHMSQTHWISLPDGSRAPKVTGRHEEVVTNRQVAEIGGILAHLALAPDGVIYQEGKGTDNRFMGERLPISSVVETGWIYPNGPQGEFLAKTMSWYHGSWNPTAVVDLLTLTRRDRTGVVQTHIRNTHPFQSKVDWFWVFRSGQALKIQIKHAGTNDSLSSSTIGPVQLDVWEAGDIQEE